MGEFVRLGDVLKAAAARLGGTEQMRAYQAWSAAVGERLAAVTAPRRFAAGTLTIECESAVWAQELTYLGGEILTSMQAADPQCPVKRLRFITTAVQRPPRRGRAD
jgi:predicted nucleic acid-binding Zn ribbon protein